MKKNKEIEEGNKLICSFMDLYYQLVSDMWYDRTGKRAFKDEPDYHTSWSRLVPVVAKASKESTMYDHVHLGDSFDKMAEGFYENDIKKTWKALIKYLKQKKDGTDQVERHNGVRGEV